MAKIKLARKKELREPDEFITLSSKLLQFAIEQKVKIAGAVGAVLAVVLIVSLSIYFSNQKENKAFTALYQLLAGYEALITDNGADKAFQDTKDDFQAFLKDHSGTVAGSMAAVRFAGICFDAGEYDKAIQWYQTALDKFGANDAYKNIILSGLGYAYAEKKDFEKALTFFEQIAAGNNPLMKAEAFYNLGLLYEATGQPEKSASAFNTVVSEYADSMYYKVAKEKTSIN